MTGPSTDPITAIVVPKAGDEHPVDRGHVDLGPVRPRFGDAECPWREVSGNPSNLEERQPGLGANDPRADQTLAGIEREAEQGGRVELFGEGRGVEKDRSRLAKSRQAREPIGEC